MYNYYFLCMYLMYNFSKIFSVEFKDITSDIFVNGHYTGIIAAFGDFNSDKLTDLFIINDNSKSVEILLSHENQTSLGLNPLSCTFSKSVIGVIPGDFNGDTIMDVLVALQSDTSELNDIYILWGHHDRVDCANISVFITHGQPFVFDYNDDMIPDVMGEDENKSRVVWLSNKSKNFTKQFITSKCNNVLQYLRKPHSSATVDLNYDLVSDVLITGISNMEFWIKSGKQLNCVRVLGYPKRAQIKGQSTFVDFDTNGKLNHIMPVCHDDNCKSCAVMKWDDSKNEWVVILEDFKYKDNIWGFIHNDDTPLEKAASPITLRAGDFNMDGYPDFVTVLQNTEKKEETKTVIFENIPCTDDPSCRTLKINWIIPGLDDIKNIKLATFYDVFEDGTMDILASSKNGSKWNVHVLKNIGTYDAYFIKVLVLSGLRSDSIPYGTNQPGPMVTYNTTKPNGEPIEGCSVQLSQSAHFSLQLPYSVFGLGQTPNFVDLLTVAIPEMGDNKTHKREWTQIIPNSQMVVIPYPPYNEKRWVNKLFLTPSHLVLLTVVALLGTCVFISLLIGLLYWKERREDKKEKMQDAHRFHFDAM